MAPKQKRLIFLEYKQKSTEKKNGNTYTRYRKKQITTINGLLNYCTRNNISFLDILVNKFNFTIYVHNKKVNSYKCRLCDSELPRAKEGWANIEQKSIKLKLCSCNTSNKLSIVKESFLTVFDNSVVGEIYDEYVRRKTKNWRPKEFDNSSIDSYIKRHGAIKGKKLYNENLPKLATASIKYYISKGLTEKEAKRALKKRQSTFSLKKCIDVLGEEKGYKRWLERQKKWQNTLTAKSQDEINTIKEKRKTLGGYSKISQVLFDSLGITDARYATNGGEYREKLFNGKHVSFDFKYGDKVIEFNGDLWHASPLKYNSGDIINIGSSRKLIVDDIWVRDEIRTSEIIKLGYDVLIIWEHEYNSDANTVKEKCLEFLNEKNNS